MDIQRKEEEENNDVQFIQYRKTNQMHTALTRVLVQIKTSSAGVSISLFCQHRNALFSLPTNKTHSLI